MSKQSFLKGAFILVSASLITRVMGFVYKIALTRLIGAEGIGLFQMIFPLISLVLTVVTAGLPVAISKVVAEAMVAGDRRRIRRVIMSSFAIIGIFSILGSVLLVFLSPWITKTYLTDSRAYYSLIAIIPVIPIIGLSSILSGYFKGLQNMSPPAVASILETAVRIASVWVLAHYFRKFGLAYAAAAAAIGMVLGELMSLLYMWLYYLTRQRIQSLPMGPANQLEPLRKTIKSILEVAIPVTCNRIIGTVAYAIEPMLISRSLQTAGFTTVMATTLYGQYSGMAIPLLVFPTVFTYSLAVTLVPSISEAIAEGKIRLVRRRLYQTFRITALIGFPTSVVLTVYATQLCTMVFHAPEVGPILTIMAPVGFLLYLQSPLYGILQGLNRAGLAMVNGLVGSAAKLLIIYFLASQPKYGILGVAWALVADVAITTGLNFFSVNKMIGFEIDPFDTAKIILATILMATVMKQITGDSSIDVPNHTVIFSIFIGFSSYFFLLLMFGVITRNMLRKIPRIGHFLVGISRFVPFSK
ncbi:stage V sporulation protein B [Fodinisporobacter ferrooxydans]|uniref:Stage V sporulation protein B n=1 Tax=Fodinisporobacter ferrooxydans TaxID=2901836 RepID=A0ABY4CGS3_9BACL|nr:stage V sporulation protein B [Alicyclobacillaceae bacterium MYW30-H2]